MSVGTVTKGLNPDKLSLEDNDKTSPSVSVLILNYNGLRYVDRCVSSVLRTDYPNFEVIFIDNASTDGSYEYVKQRYGASRHLKIIRNSKNYGFARGNNLGAKYARGEYLVFLNVDTEVEPNWLKELVRTMESDPSIGAAQAKLLRMDDPRRLDTCGHKLTPYGFTYEVGLNEDANRYNEPFEILAGKGAALIVRRSVFEEVGGFDEEYFVLREETDMCWRIWLRGYRVVFTPDARVFHAIGGIFKQVKLESLYFFQRNMIMTLIKNLGLRNLLKILPVHLLLLLMDSFVNDLKVGKAYRLIVSMKSLSYVLANLKHVCSKRLKVQAMRRVGDGELFKHIMIKVSVLEKMRERSRLAPPMVKYFTRTIS